MSANTSEKYPLLMRILHWAIALLILTLIAVGYIMTDLPKDDPDRGFVYGLHKSFGVLVLLLVAIRLAVRLISKIPPLPEGIPAIVRKLAHGAHYVLYILMFATPIAGIWMSNAYGYPVAIFGLTLPKVFPDNLETAKLMNEVHEYLAYTVLFVVILHAAGALKHRFFEKPENDVLRRML